ncbi:MAG: prephenate dehydrogenase/arogenate dehydrogenase family protein [Spirochaetales bacterium]|nr:prephenate dehydrogenase/arogenate dehydrogenase family protein [Spirochaetales bacterium]
MVIGVYGLGRFGGFWAKTLATRHTVLGWSRDASRPLPPGVRRGSEEEVLSADVVILCVSISAFEDVVQRIASKLKPGALLMDTCSVKVHPARVMLENVPKSVELLATHPMFGPDSGKNGVEGLPLVFSPLRMEEEHVKVWKDHFKNLGLNLVEMTPEDHDKEAACTQGITHFIGRVLGELKLEPSSIATTGYRDLLDIVRQTCNDPWQLFVDLQQYNPYTVEMRQDVHRAIATMLNKFDSIDALDG